MRVCVCLCASVWQGVIMSLCNDLLILKQQGFFIWKVALKQVVTG